MNEKLKQPLLWIATLLLALPLVHAAGITDLLQPLVDLFGPGGYTEFYQYAQGLLDSLLITLLFYFVFKSAPYAKNLGNGAVITISIILGIAFMGLERATGFTLAKLGPVAFVILIIILVGLLAGALRHVGLKNKMGIFLIIFILLYSVLLNGPPEISGPMNRYIDQYPLIDSVLGLMYALSLIFALVWFVQWIVSSVRGNTKTAGTPNEVLSNLGKAGSEMSKDFSKWNKERKEKSHKEAEEGTKRAQELGKQVRDKLEQDVITHAQNTQRLSADVDALQNSVQATNRFADDAYGMVQSAVKQPGWDYNTFRSNIAGQQAQLSQYFSQQLQIAAEMDKVLETDNVNNPAVKKREDVFKELNDYKTVQFVTEQKYITGITDAISKLKDEYTEINKQLDEARKVNANDAGKAQALQQTFAQQYTDQLNVLQGLQTQQANRRSLLQGIKSRFEQIEGLFNQRKKINDEQKKLTEKLIGKEQILKKYQDAFLNFLKEPGDTKLHTKLAEASAPVLTTVNQIKQYTPQKQGIEQAIQKLTTELADLDQQHGSNAEQWSKEIDNALERQLILFSTAKGLEELSKAVMLKNALLPRKLPGIQSIPGMKVLVLGTSYSGVLGQANAVGSSYVHQHQDNAKIMAKYVESKFDPIIKELATARNNATLNNPKDAAGNITGVQEINDAIVQVEALQKELEQLWEADVTADIARRQTP